MSDRDIEALRTVSEDYFGMGDAWKKKKQEASRPTFPQQQTPTPTEAPQGRPEATIPTVNGKSQTTVDTLLTALANKNTDAPSFGDLYNRPHDGDTAKTSQKEASDDVSLSSHESDKNDQDVTFADIPPTIRPPAAGAGDASTAKSSTHYRLQRDKSRELAAKSQEESRQLLETLRREREELMKTREELERLRVSSHNPKTVTPSANRGKAGAAADSAGASG